MITSYEFFANWLRARIDDERGASVLLAQDAQRLLHDR